jgi:hypothetical protein
MLQVRRRNACARGPILFLGLRDRIPNSGAIDMTTDDYDPDPDEYKNADEAAAALRQKPSTLATWRYEGRGPAYTKSGRTVLYHPRDLARYLQSRRRDPTGA